MFRSYRSLTRLTLISAAALLAACSAADQVTSPKLRRVAKPAGSPSLDVIINAVAPDSMSADFTVTPSGGLFALGNHAVFFPANSICDPETSSYGPDQWDAPCTPVDHAIDFHAEVRRDENGRTWIDFTPAVRFVPTDDPNQTVWLLMKAGADVNEDNYRNFSIKWLPNGSPDETVEESSVDPALRTYVDIENDVLLRRLKHFSGYATEGTVVSLDSDLARVDIMW